MLSLQSYRLFAKPCDNARMTTELSIKLRLPKSVILSLSKDQFSPPKKTMNYRQ
jgi:hypothetical protein